MIFELIAFLRLIPCISSQRYDLDMDLFFSTSETSYAPSNQVNDKSVINLSRASNLVQTSSSFFVIDFHCDVSDKGKCAKAKEAFKSAGARIVKNII